MATGYVYRIKRTDTLPALLLRLLDGNGDVLDLTSVTTATLRLGVNGSLLEREMRLLDPLTAGQVDYAFQPEDWPYLPRGRFVAEVGLVYANGSTLTVPTVGGFVVEVEAAATP